MRDPLGSLVEAIGALVDALESSGLAYALGGAVAYSAWAEPRATRDVDVNFLDLYLDSTEGWNREATGYSDEDPLLYDLCKLIATLLQRVSRRDDSSQAADGAAVRIAVHAVVSSAAQRLVEIARDHRWTTPGLSVCRSLDRMQPIFVGVRVSSGGLHARPTPRVLLPTPAYRSPLGSPGIADSCGSCRRA